MMIAIDADGLVLVAFVVIFKTLTMATVRCIALIDLICCGARAELIDRCDWELTLVRHYVLHFKRLTRLISCATPMQVAG